MCVLTEMRKERLPNTDLERHRQTNLCCKGNLFVLLVWVLHK
jgi:hypothetical protein